MSAETSLSELAGWARALARAESPAIVFKTLLEASRMATPRAAVFLLRRVEIRGWGSVGYSTDAAQAQRAFKTAVDRLWLGDTARKTDGAPCPRPDGCADPNFGQDEAEEAVACVVRIDDQPIALILGERERDEEPWLPEALALLAGVAQLRLEVNLARRVAAESAAATATESTAEAEPAPAARADEGTTAPEASPTTADPTDDAASPDYEVARRYARLVATDIRLYNEEAVVLGRRNGDLVERLGEQIDRGKETFVRRHGDLGPTGLALLREAYVEVLAAGDAALMPTNVVE